jgi:hypothetical protein
MTIITLCRSYKVACRGLTGSIGAIVARFAYTVRFRTMDPCAARECCRGMAEMAIQRRCNVCRIGLGIFSDSRIAIMARATIVYDAGMIECCASKCRPDTDAVTDTTILISSNMCTGFACRENAVMTGTAVIYDTCMVKRCGEKPGGHVALAAIIISWHVIWWRRLASCGRTIVALRAVIYDALMIEPGTSESNRVMANRTILRRRKMTDRFARCKAGIMTGRAIAHDTSMAEHGCSKCSGYVTDAAILRGRNVAHILVRCRTATIMTFGTIVHPAGMIKARATNECTTSDTMTHTAIFGGGRMCWRLSNRSGRNIICAAIMAWLTISCNSRMRKYRRDECRVRVANITILIRRQMRCRLDDIRICIGCRQELAVMTSFTAIGYTRMNIAQECWWRKSTRTGACVTHITLVLRRNMIRNFSYRADRNIIGVAVMAWFTIIGDTGMREV